MHQITTILRNAGYNVTKNVYVGTNSSYVQSLSVYCVGVLLASETAKLKKILSSYNVSVIPMDENILIKLV